MHFTVIDELLNAGTYTDTLTFLVAVVDDVTGYKLVTLTDIIDDEGIKFNCKTVPYGFVSPDARVWFQEFEDTNAFGEKIQEFSIKKNN